MPAYTLDYSGNSVATLFASFGYPKLDDGARVVRGGWGERSIPAPLEETLRIGVELVCKSILPRLGDFIPAEPDVSIVLRDDKLIFYAMLHDSGDDDLCLSVSLKNPDPSLDAARHLASLAQEIMAGAL